MNLTIKFGAPIGMLALSGIMMFYDYSRSKAGRPLSQHEHKAIPFWVMYLLLLVLGFCLLLSAIIR
jgi:hypothetical protein